MSHSSLLLLLASCGFLLSTAPADACPVRCECAPQFRSVICHRKRLTSVPEGIPAETKVLELSKNRIRCLNPGDLSSFPLLEDLDLSENIIAHVEPGAFGNLFNLQTLRLRCNQLKLIPPGVFRKLTNLTLLDISENKIVVLLDYMFQDLRNLKHLEVGDNDLVYISRKAFSGLVGLQELTIEKCNLTDLSAESLSHLRNLEALRLRHFSIPVVEDQNFRTLGQLQLLEMDSWVGLEEIASKGFQGLNLTSLFITFTNLTQVPTAALRSLGHLVYLNLSYNPISTVPRGAFQELTRLKELHMAGALLASVEPQAFYGLRQIRLLNLSNNFLLTLEESTFHSVNTLETLRVDQNPLVCDCRLLWILQRRKTLNFDGQPPTCSSPLEIQGNALQDFPDTVLFEYFTCRKPQIRDRRLQHVAASEGQEVSFQCQAEGEPMPTISWVSPQHQMITSKGLGRATILPSGTLEIHPIRIQDSGTYTCIASNAAGNDTYFATLMVRGHSVDGISESNHTPYLGEFNGSFHNDSLLEFTLDLKTIFVSTAMGCITFLGVVLFCFLLLFLWSRGRGQHKNHFSVEYAFRKVDGPTAASGQCSSRKFNMKMI